MEQHDNGTRKDLVKYRIRSAKEDLKSAQILLEAGSLKAANNRAYYAIFHAINAVHATAECFCKLVEKYILEYKNES